MNETPQSRDVDALERRIGGVVARLRESEASVRAWSAVGDIDAGQAAEGLGRIPPEQRGPLFGMVVGVKDVIDVAGFATRAGSRARADAPPAQADATVVERLRRAGCIVIGKTKTTEFAYTDPTDTANPHNLDHTPGGSSSGSAAAVAAGSADLTLGTQTVGSVCRPAAYCGVSAFKPSTGAMPATGVTPFSRSFDTIGFMSRDIRLSVAAARCCASRDRAARADDGSAVWAGWTNLRVGLLADPYYAADPEMTSALAVAKNLLAENGATLREFEAGCDFQAMRDQQRIVFCYEAARAHPDLLSEPDLLGPNWRGALEAGRKTSEAEYVAARDRLAEAKVRLAETWSSADIMLLPPARTVAPEGLQSTGDAALIAPWTIAGSPLAVLPVGKNAKGLPTAVMIAGRPWMDGQAARIAIALQDALWAAGFGLR